MAKIVDITIDEHGNVEVDMNGWHGEGCHAVQELITGALGGEVKKEVRKAEFNKPLKNQKCVTR
jgi:hypothetical protein